MSQNIIDLYEPLNIPKPFDQDIWIVDGPIVRMAMYGTHIPFPTRMTIIRLKNNDLWCHSPIELVPELKAKIDALGSVRHLISPNKIHYAHIGSWAKAYPEAIAWGYPGVVERAAQQKVEVTFDAFLDDEAPVYWSEDIAQLVFRGSRFMDEVVFFHRKSSTVILADLIENFELNKVSKKFHLLIKLAGCAAPNGKAPLDLRTTFWGRKNQARGCLQKMLKWEAKKIILSHGKCYEENGNAELIRAFAWLVH